MRNPLGNNVGRYLVFNPDYPEPPSKWFTTAEQARAVARKMAQENPGEPFVVMQAQGVAIVSDDPYVPLAD